MKTLVDTCVLSEVQRRKPHPGVRERFAAIAEEDLYLSALTIGELRKGVHKLRTSAKKRQLSAWCDLLVQTAGDRVLPVDAGVAEVWGELAAAADKRGRTLPVVDGLIAATAVHHGMRLMTRNTTDFEATGVMLFNPWEGG